MLYKVFPHITMSSSEIELPLMSEFTDQTFSEKLHWRSVYYKVIV